ncbi:MAG: hypothetical protein ACLPX9_07660 [Rhodomicrobium sp.]
MAENRLADTHPVWEDMLAFGLGVLIVLTPYFTADAVSQTVQLATTFAGLLVIVAAVAEHMQLFEGESEPAREWEAVLQSLLGAGLIALPFILGYANSGTLRYWHFALGGIVFLLAIVELRRDYVGDMKSHGWWRQTQ